MVCVSEYLCLCLCINVCMSVRVCVCLHKLNSTYPCLFIYDLKTSLGTCLESGAHLLPRPLGCDIPRDVICIERPAGAIIPSCFQKISQWPPSLAPFKSKYSKHTECYLFRAGERIDAFIYAYKDTYIHAYT